MITLKTNSYYSKLITITLLCGFFSFSFSQEFINPLKLDKKDKEFLYGLDNRRTHIQGQSTLIYGAYIGIGFERSLRFKIGVSGTPFERGRTVGEDGLIQRNRFYFLNIGEEYDFFVSNRFRITAYLQGGWGFNDFRRETVEGVTQLEGRDMIVPIEAGLHFGYDIYPWLQAKLGGGWRFVLPETSNYLAGYYIKVGLSISSRKLYRSYLKRKEKKEKAAEEE